MASSSSAVRPLSPCERSPQPRASTSGWIHRYVGSKDDIIASVLARHTERARTTATELNDRDLMTQVAETVVNRPATGRLVGGMILDGVDVARVKGDFPLLDRLAENDHALKAAMTYALALGWEVFGPSLLAALETSPDPTELAAALSDAMNAIRASNSDSVARESKRFDSF